MIGKEVVLFNSLNSTHEIRNTTEFQRKSINVTTNTIHKSQIQQRKNVSVTKQ